MILRSLSVSCKRKKRNIINKDLNKVNSHAQTTPTQTSAVYNFFTGAENGAKYQYECLNFTAVSGLYNCLQFKND